MNIKSLILVLMVAISAVACTSKTSNVTEQLSDSQKVVVCYFSATGTTKAQAQRLANIIGADVHEILPDPVYTDADLDWRDQDSRSTIEMKDTANRPAIGNEIDLTGYDIVFIGYPNWWNTAPRIINTFIESNDLSGKTIVPFMTSGGSGITNSEKELSEAYPNLRFAKGLLMNDVTDDDIVNWVMSIGVAVVTE